MDDFDPIGKALGIPSVNALQEKIEKLPANVSTTGPTQTFVQSDYEYARQGLKELIDQGSYVFAAAAELANQSQNPEQFEAVSSMFKHMVDAHKELMNLSVAHKKVTNVGVAEEENKNTGVTNNLFVGSTSELQKILEDINKKK